MERYDKLELIKRFNNIGMYIYHQIKNAIPDLEQKTNNVGFFCMGMNHALLHMQGFMLDPLTNNVIDWDKLFLNFIENVEKHLEKIKSGENKSFREALIQEGK